jgi:Cu-Zn family superoxide dismutase
MNRKLTVLLGAFAAAVPSAAAPAPTKAVAVVNPTPNSAAANVNGIVLFVKEGTGLRVTVGLKNLTPGPHGFHIHEFGDCSAPDGSSAGGHFNPEGAPHGAPSDEKHHAGDFGNVEAKADGSVTFSYVDPKGTLEGPNSVIGRAVIVHEKADDLKTQPTGNAGGRLACGTIGVAKAE